MLFNSGSFLIFFPIVLLIYYIIPKKARNYWLLIASYYFYMSWNAKYAILIFFSTVVTYIGGILIEKIKQSEKNKTTKSKYKKMVVFFTILINLAILFHYKYSGFALDILNSLFSFINVEITIPTFDIILPVGISFYTFQALSYTIDVYRDEIYAEKNFFRYALFVSFFPQLVAGPIERSKNLLTQLAKDTKFNFEKAKKGFLLMLYGFFLKIVIADRIAIFVDSIYGEYTHYQGVYLIVATVLFAFQIYCDFYGYSVIATGAAKILGIQLMENFDAPYFSKSVSEFWRRWHISLSSWFKDYVYIPLGGSRKGKIRKYINKMVVFLVSGLWHGASFTFIVWGGLNGLYQIIAEICKNIKDKIGDLFRIDRSTIDFSILQMLGTFVLIDFSWIFFRAKGLAEAFTIIKLFFVWNPEILFNGQIYECGVDRQNFMLLIFCLCVLLFADYCKYKKMSILEIVLKQNRWFQCTLVMFSLIFILIFGIYGPEYNAANFIYFQF